ncbi:MAG: amphi-Trp domain-containing protein [Desulfovermiculus sp.]
MAANNDFFHESVQDTASIKDFLQSLQEALEQKRIILSADGQEMILTPSSLLQLSVKARKKGASNKLQIKIVWEDTVNSDSGYQSGLSIRS